VVLGEKPLISEDTSPLDVALLDELISNMATLASVYHKPPQAFVSKLKKKVKVLTDALPFELFGRRRCADGRVFARSLIPAKRSSTPAEESPVNPTATKVHRRRCVGIHQLRANSALVFVNGCADQEGARGGEGSLIELDSSPVINPNDPFGFLSSPGPAPTTPVR
jgi:hypothetical protein